MACESSVIYRRRNLGKVSVAAVAELLLFDAENPRSLVFQLERLRANLRAMPGASGSSRPERLLDEIMTRVRRLDPADLEDVDEDGRRAELRGLLDGVHSGLRELSTVITATQLSLPGGMQPLWGPDQRRSAVSDLADDRVSGRSGGLAVGAGFRPQLPRDASHRVPVLRRRDQFLRPWLPDAPRLRAAALPDPSLDIDPEPTDQSTSRDVYGNIARFSTSPNGTGR